MTRPDLCDLLMTANSLGITKGIDPFYNDGYINNFFAFLAENWTSKED